MWLHDDEKERLQAVDFPVIGTRHQKKKKNTYIFG